MNKRAYNIFIDTLNVFYTFDLEFLMFWNDWPLLLTEFAEFEEFSQSRS